MTHDFPTVEEVIDIHDGAVREFGGSLGLRDMGALESALFRARQAAAWALTSVGKERGPVSTIAGIQGRIRPVTGERLS